MMDIAVVGAGVNGIMAAWALATRGARVVVYERASPMSATSAASSRMLHGGVRYLGNLQLGFVREALQERDWWIRNAPEHIESMRFHIPVRSGNSRNALTLRLGTWIYDRLAGAGSLGKSRWLGAAELGGLFPALRKEGLAGAATYVDAVMDDSALSDWLVAQAGRAGVEIIENTGVGRISEEGEVTRESGESVRYDHIVNAAGPWAGQLAERSGIELPYQLALVRGMHLLLDWQVVSPLLLQNREDDRVVFLLPVGEQVLLGTTEVVVKSPDDVAGSDVEADYLLDVLGKYFEEPSRPWRSRIVGSYAGIRPLVSRKGVSAGRLSREHELIATGRVLHVIGGKWTTSRRLGVEVAKQLLSHEYDGHMDNILWRSD